MATRYSFAYLKLAERLAHFEPLPGLPDVHRRYDSDQLFPVFANRVMPRRRPDYDLFTARLDLTGDADPFEVLARSGGRRATDRIEVFAAPQRTAEGRARCSSSPAVSATFPAPRALWRRCDRAIDSAWWTRSTTRTTPGRSC